MADEGSSVPELERIVKATVPVVDFFVGFAGLNAPRILQEGLIARGIRARTVATDVLVGNAIFLQDKQRLGRLPRTLAECSQGAFSVGVNNDGQKVHVVSFARGHVIDLTVKAFERPDRGILTPLVFASRAPLHWIGGRAEEALEVELEGMLFLYRARPDLRRFEAHPDWKLDGVNQEAVESVLASLQGAEVTSSGDPSGN